MTGYESSCENPIFFILGSTGCGKSLAAVKVAKTLKNYCGYKKVVIINCDVMQFYADLPIATNKISSTEMEGINHYFIGFLSSKGIKIRDPTLPYEGCDKFFTKNIDDTDENGIYNVHSYVQDVVKFIEQFFKEYNSSAIIICGGTCYYAQALMFNNVLTEEDFNDSVDNISFPIKNNKDENLWFQLNEIDPTVAVRYHPNDKRRIIRLLDIYKKTGRLPSEIYESRSTPSFRYNSSRCFIFWIYVEFEKLKIILDERVDKMVKNGIVEEFLDFAHRYILRGFNFTIAQAIGFKEFLSAFEEKDGKLEKKSENDLRDSIIILKNNTRRYAKQQIQWIKNRFLGRFRNYFLSTEGINRFLCIDASNKREIFFDIIEKATMSLVNFKEINIEGLIYPLKENPKKIVTVKQEWCQICEMFVCGGDQINVHLNSKRHKGAIKHAALVKEQQEKYGRVIPSRKRPLS